MIHVRPATCPHNCGVARIVSRCGKKKKKKSALRGVIPPRASRGSRTAKTTAFRASFRRQQESFGTKRLWYKRMRNCIPHECTATDACIVLHPFVKKKKTIFPSNEWTATREQSMLFVTENSIEGTS